MTPPTLEPPPGWEQVEWPSAPTTVVQVVAEPVGVHPAFRPNLVLTVGCPPFEDQATVLRSFNLIDREEEVDLDGGSCVRTLAHHEVKGQAVVVEHWRRSRPAGSHELTASCGARDYPELAETFAASAASLR